MLKNKLLELRNKKGVSQKVVAEALGVHQQVISFWELGIRKPNLDQIVLISNFFGCTIDELLKGEEKSDVKED